MKAIPVAALVLLVTACGGSKAGPPGPATAGAPALAYSRCMRAHSVPSYPDPSSSGGIVKESAQQLGVTYPVLQAAARACAPLIPSSGGNGPTTAEVQQEWHGMLTFARCMRSHGVQNWPDPVPYPQNPSRPTFILPDSVQPTSEVVATMYQCQRLVPNNAVGGHIDNDSWQSVSQEMAPGS
jgi:hypothetical protein